MLFNIQYLASLHFCSFMSYVTDLAACRNTGGLRGLAKTHNQVSLAVIAE